MDVMPAIPSGNNYSGVEASGVFVCESSGGCEQRVDDTLFLFYDEECGAAHDTQSAWIISPLAPQVALERNLHGKNNGGCWNWVQCAGNAEAATDPLKLQGEEWNSWDMQCASKADGQAFHPTIMPSPESIAAGKPSGRADLVISGLCDTAKGNRDANGRWIFQGVTADSRPWYKKQTSEDAASLEAAKEDAGECSCLPPAIAKPLSAQHPLVSGDGSCPAAYNQPASPQACAHAAAVAGFPARFGVQAQCTDGDPCDPDVYQQQVEFRDGSRKATATLPRCFVAERECNRLIFSSEGNANLVQGGSTDAQPVMSICIPHGWSENTTNVPPQHQQRHKIDNGNVLWATAMPMTYIECEAACGPNGVLACGRSQDGLRRIIDVADRPAGDVWVANHCEGHQQQQQQQQQQEEKDDDETVADRAYMETDRVWASNQDAEVYPTSRQRSLACVCEDFASQEGVCDWDNDGRRCDADDGDDSPAFADLCSCKEWLGEEYGARGNSGYRTMSLVKLILTLVFVGWSSVLLKRMIQHRQPSIRHPFTRAQACLLLLIISLTMDAIDYARVTSGSTFSLPMDIGSVDSYGDSLLFLAVALFGWLFTDLLELVRRQNGQTSDSGSPRPRIQNQIVSEARATEGLCCVRALYAMTALVCIPHALWFASEGGMGPGSDMTGIESDLSAEHGGDEYNLAGVFAGWCLLTPAAVMLESRSRHERAAAMVARRYDRGENETNDAPNEHEQRLNQQQQLSIRLHWVAKVNIVEQVIWNILVSICFVVSKSTRDDMLRAFAVDALVFVLFLLQHGQLCFFFSTVGAPKLVQSSELTPVEDGSMLQSMLLTARNPT